MPIKDMEKRREYRRTWYSKNKKSEKTHVKRRKKEIQDWFKKFKEDLSCSKCDENHPSTIDFHHKGEKEDNVSKLVSNGYSIEKIKKEIEKCIILCSNCHRKEHYNQ